MFILWLGWYGFNGAAATSIEELGSVFVTTTIAPSVATVVTMILTWVKYGKPDVSMCLNASLAGLVALTAPCDVCDAFGAIVIGAVSGVLVVFGVWFLDNVLHVDDPVGAVAVHFLNGIWGTIAVGLFATDTAPAFKRGLGDGVTFGANQIAGEGLFYGGGFKQLGIQLLGMLSTLAWTAVTITLAFFIIKKIFGLRVSREEEIEGLDVKEHGLQSAYAGFAMLPEYIDEGEELPEITGDVPVAEAVEVKEMPKVAADVEPKTKDGKKLTKVEIICKESKLESVKNAMVGIGITGMTVTHVLGCGVQKGQPEYYRGALVETSLLPKIQIDIVVSEVPVPKVIATAKKVLYTGHIGDGKIFVYDVENVVKVRTGEEGYDALQGTEQF